MHVLVTGGAGYIGSVIARRLLAGGHDVTVYDDLSRGHLGAVPSGARLVQGDIRDTDLLASVLADGAAVSVIHMAALAEVGESVRFPERYRDVNERGTASVVAACEAAGVGRLVFSSTAAVYGEPRQVPIDEDDPLEPSNPYGATKLAGERLLAAARDKGSLAFTALRYFNACGADGEAGEDHDPESHLIPLALRAVRDATPLRVFGDDYPTPDGTCLRDYVHVVDLAEAHIAALEHLPQTSGCFNLGTGHGDSVMTVLDTVEEIAGRRVDRTVVERRPGDPPALVASNARAGSFLGWRPRRSLRDAVADAWRWLQAHPQGYDD